MLQDLRAILLNIFLLLGALFFTPGCASTHKETLPQTLITWPEGTDARIQYLESIRSAADFGIKPSAFSRLGKVFTGRSKNSDQFDKPFGIAVDEHGTLFITDTSAASLSAFDRTNKKVQSWSRFDKTRLIMPVAVAIAGDVIFLADSGMGEVLALNEKGRILFRIKEPLSRPSGLAIQNGHLYVADSQAHTVFVFDLAGQFQSRFGKRGSGPGELNFPTHIATGPNGEIFVTDSMNGRVMVFNGDGSFSRQIGSLGDTSGHFSRPKGIAVDSGGRLYVLDALFDNFQIFDKEGHFLLDIGKAGAAEGEFWLPNGIAISAANEIYITDSYNQRVQVFKYVGPP
jgi:DNA-binding beta-propeller fold protein YncE